MGGATRTSYGGSRVDRVLRADPRRKVPAPPPWLADAERREWRSLWRGPLGDLWTEVDVPEVGRYFRLRESVAAQPAVASLHAQLSVLTTRLGLNPAGRQLLRVALEGDARAGVPVVAGPVVRRRDPRAAAL